MNLDPETGDACVPHNGTPHSFKFDKCFAEQTSQADLFTEVSNAFLMPPSSIEALREEKRFRALSRNIILHCTAADATLSCNRLAHEGGEC